MQLQLLEHYFSREAKQSGEHVLDFLPVFIHKWQKYKCKVGYSNYLVLLCMLAIDSDHQ